MTGLWADTREIPVAVARTVEAADGFAEVADLLGRPQVRRVVASGNGASYYAASALWLASLVGPDGPEVVSVPAGLLARDAFRWRDGDVLLAFSSSGELRDLLEALDGRAPSPYALVTASPTSRLAVSAGARALVEVVSQRAVTHTQAYCGSVAAALAVWAEVTGDGSLRAALAGLPAVLERLVSTAPESRAGLARTVVEAPAAVAFGTGPAWAAALEAALLLKEVARVPAEGVETREGATSAMFGLSPGHLVLSLAGAGDPLGIEAEEICRARGASVVRVEGVDSADIRLAAVTTFPAVVALTEWIGLERGLNVDAPDWVDPYYRVARSAR
jgi:fructoselysine-6-P-deglycase FrlB-like protein